MNKVYFCKKQEFQPNLIFIELDKWHRSTFYRIKDYP